MQRANAAESYRRIAESEVTTSAGALRGRTASWPPVTAILVAGALLIPLIVSVHGEDPFRFPKDLALRAEVILIIAALLLGWLFGRLERPRVRMAAWSTVTGLICIWTVICAVASSNRLITIVPTTRVLEYALLFIVTASWMRKLPAWIAGVIVPPAVVNAAVYVLQETELWTPFDTSAAPEKHLTRTALMGNPNYVGSYLVAPAVVALALALTQRRGRAAWATAAAFLIAATFMTHTVGAIGALIIAVPVMLAIHLRSWRKVAVAVLAAMIAAGATFAAYKPLHDRLDIMIDALKRRDYETLSAGRTMAFLAAAEMVRDHPLTGVGPGGFAYNYFDYKLRIQEQRRSLFGPEGATPENFGEVHSDHLQVASETGLPGYALFAAALVLLALPTWRRAPATSPHAALARVLALPLVVSFAVLAVAQFPLELVAATHAYVWAAAAAVAGRMS